jgi:DNA-binding Lrp family transcriptional regulator
VFVASGVLCGIAALVVLRIPRAPRLVAPLPATAPLRPRLRGVSEEIDGLDSRLLLMLRAHPRVGVVEIARRLGVARGTVQARMDKLVARGVITGFGPEVEPALMGYPVLAFTSLEIVQGRLEEAVATLSRVPEVLEVHGVTGDRDLLCRVVARDNTHLQDVINAMLHTGAVQRSTSAISMTRQIPYRIEPLIAAAATDR